MNKKILAILVIIIIVVIGIFVCFAYNKTSKQNTQNIQNDDLQNTNVDLTGNVLVTYFSHSGENYSVGNVEKGNTKMMAEYIIDYLNADSFEIVPNKNYPESYDELVEQAQHEQRNNIEVGYVGEQDISDYEIIFIGYPIWDGEIPMVVDGFINNHNFDGKVVIPFNTHEGSGNAGTYEILKEKLNNSTVLEGLPIKGTISRTEEGKNKTIEWLKKLGFKETEKGKENVSKSSQNVVSNEQTEQKTSLEEQENTMDNIKIKIDNEILNVELEKNQATNELVERLKKGNITINSSEYGGFEQVANLGFNLTTSDTKITTNPGDIVLYQGNQISLSYGSNSWSYTKLGKITNKSDSELKNILGKESLTLTLTIND